MSGNRVKGHESIWQGFQQVTRRNRLAHSYLFVGPSGIGKRMFAYELAQALLCEGKPTQRDLHVCGVCPSCRLMDAGTHPDCFLVKRPEEENVFPIEVMRELCQKFALKSARGKGKIAIVDDADDLNDASANCFLKTLEEPPPQSVFFLIGTSRQQQIPTILSRCQVVRFPPLSQELVTQILLSQGLPKDERLQQLLRLCPGSPGQALSLSDPELWEFRRTFLKDLVQTPFNPVQSASKWLEFVENAGKESAMQRQRAENGLKLLLAFLRDALAFLVEGQPALTAPDDAQTLQAFASQRSPERILYLTDRCMEASRQIRIYIQLPLVLEGLLDAFCEV